MKRTLILETKDKVNVDVLLFGWVNSIREHGNVVFIDLRDRSGVVQLVGDKKLADLSKESIIKVEGKVVSRNENYFNQKIETGKVEVNVKKVEVLSEAKTPPFEISEQAENIDEQLRLKYRYLDLRCRRMHQNIMFRSQLANLFRQSLLRREFAEIETPLLTKSTPEGARDFLVPSRIQPGNFYALPQSPQQYKQLLMVSGFERYFQLARCLRDEDLRADRQFEFTQVDMEMSFMNRDEIIEEMESVVIEVFSQAGFKFKHQPFPRIEYQEAINKYGNDSFDLRSEKEKNENILAFSWVIDFPLFEKTEVRSLNPSHHPFTAPNPEDLNLLDSSPEKVRSLQYDLVCNGHEVGGGSIRITDPQIQAKVFSLLGHTNEEIDKKFGHLLKSFDYGVPPHGGLAIGFDRLCAIACQEKSIREVIAFPVNSSGQTAVMDAPAEVNDQQLEELGIQLLPDLKNDN